MLRGDAPTAGARCNAAPVLPFDAMTIAKDHREAQVQVALARWHRVRRDPVEMLEAPASACN